MPSPYGTKTKRLEAERVARVKARAAARLAAAKVAEPAPARPPRSYTFRDPLTGQLQTFEVLN